MKGVVKIPLKRGFSQSIIEENIAELIKSGKTKEVAVAIAFALARKSAKKAGRPDIVRKLQPKKDGSDDKSGRHSHDKKEGAEKPPPVSASEKVKRKIRTVMEEFKKRKLKDASGKIVTDRKQAIAIALSKARAL